jgi:hypothetical protein
LDFLGPYPQIARKRCSLAFIKPETDRFSLALSSVILTNGTSPTQTIILILFTLVLYTPGYVPFQRSFFYPPVINLHAQIHDYPQLLREITRLLRPGGLVLLIEPNLTPMADGKSAVDFPDGSGLHGWFTLWETYRACLTRNSIDITVPERLAELLIATKAFENVVVQDGNIPVGFWPSGTCLFLYF